MRGVKGFRKEKRILRQEPNSSSASAEDTKRDLLKETIKTWQPHTHRLLTDEDAREITENMVGFFKILQEWETKERKS